VRRQPDEDQALMGALLQAEQSRCPNGHPLALSLQALPFKVEDIVCEWCKAQAIVSEQQGKGMPDSYHAGRFWTSRLSAKGRGDS
jgi:hypothetical protein